MNKKLYVIVNLDYLFLNYKDNIIQYGKGDDATTFDSYELAGKFIYGHQLINVEIKGFYKQV